MVAFFAKFIILSVLVLSVLCSSTSLYPAVNCSFDWLYCLYSYFLLLYLAQVSYRFRFESATDTFTCYFYILISTLFGARVSLHVVSSYCVVLWQGTSRLISQFRSLQKPLRAETCKLVICSLSYRLVKSILPLVESIWSSCKVKR